MLKLPEQVKAAMDLLTVGHRTQTEVESLLGKEITRKAIRQLNEIYSNDHIPWYAKKW